MAMSYLQAVGPILDVGCGYGPIGLTLARKNSERDVTMVLWGGKDATVLKAWNFARADEIRDFLKEKGILLEDTAQGVRWKRG